MPVPERVEEYLARCRELVKRAEATLPDLIAHGANAWNLEQIEGYLSHARRQIDQVDRRLLQGEVIPQHEKVFSIFEPHTRWIAKGKAGCPVELGVPVCILEDQHGFILHHEVMWQGNDVDYAVPIVETSQERFPDLRAVSFDRGFHSPENRVGLDELLDHNVLPKKGYLNQGGAGARAGRGIRGNAWSASGRGVGDQQPRAPRPRPGSGTRRQGLCPRRRPLRSRPEHPPHRPSAAPQGTTTTRRLTAPSEIWRLPGPLDTGTEGYVPQVSKVTEFSSRMWKTGCMT